MTDTKQRNLKNLKERMAKDGFDGLVISKGSDIKYLTGFSGEYGVSTLLITGRKNYFITDNRFTHQAEKEIKDFEVVSHNSTPNSNYYKKTGELIGDIKPKRCGYYPNDLTYKNFMDMKGQAGDVNLAEAHTYVTDMRAVKTPDEINKIRKACRISMLSFYSLLENIKANITEIDIANELEYQFRRHGGEGACFDTIVASGPDNGANPHNTVTNRKIGLGDFVTLDFGTFYEGYCSDMTRTISIGEPKNKELKKMFKAVAEAKEAGEKALRPGLKMCELHKVINSVVEKAGYNIPHGPGHGFGLELHEDPFITATNEFELRPGVIHTIEPGIYIPGTGGVRQEDDYLITDTGYEKLSYITEELIIL